LLKFVREIIYPDFSRNFRKNFEIYEPGCHNGYKTDPQGAGQHLLGSFGAGQASPVLEHSTVTHQDFFVAVAGSFVMKLVPVWWWVGQPHPEFPKAIALFLHHAGL
jgi:hypothetical protein